MIVSFMIMFHDDIGVYGLCKCCLVDRKPKLHIP